MDNGTDGIPEVTPGEILAEEFLQPMGISVYRPVKDTDIPVTLISEILEGRGRITAKRPFDYPPTSVIPPSSGWVFRMSTSTCR